MTDTKYVCPKSFIVDFRMSPAVNVSGKTVAFRAGSGVPAFPLWPFLEYIPACKLHLRYRVDFSYLICFI
ncbi:MAG: hypothetical protein LBT01_05960 [Spirochaetaceae bacterium]|nr:hypothetical protein [Spirochaetaceae bacterium]